MQDLLAWLFVSRQTVFFLTPFPHPMHSKGMVQAMADQQAELASLLQVHQAGVWRYLRFLGCDPDETDDLVQETFLVVLREGFEQRSPSETSAYLRTVARNRLLMERRKHRNLLPVGDLEATEAVWATFAGEDGLSDYLVALGECLEVAVSPRDRQALELQYHDQASRAKIAAELELAVEGVKTLLRRARSALRDCVERKLER
jgi:RNA polymerase sigma-70 factor (ECF subfamily)